MGVRDPGGNKIVSSHAEEHGRIIGNKEPYDNFIRGWIGANKSYPYAVIHFAPPIPKENPALFDKGFSTLEMFVKNGAVRNTLIRGFPDKWEQPLSKIIKFDKTPLLERLEQKKQEIKEQAAGKVERTQGKYKVRASPHL